MTLSIDKPHVLVFDNGDGTLRPCDGRGVKDSISSEFAIFPDRATADANLFRWTETGSTYYFPVPASFLFDVESEVKTVYKVTPR